MYYRRFGGTCYLRDQSKWIYSSDRDMRCLWNVDTYIPGYTVSHSRDFEIYTHRHYYLKSQV